MPHAPLPTNPEVSVLMPVHNGEAYVEPAVRSIMTQTLQDIEIIVVDDASTDGTAKILARLMAEDPRIRLETLTENMRLPRALNRGLELVRAPYVARMDADDIAHPTRLAVQKDYMDAHPEVILLGTSLRYIAADGEVRTQSVRPRDGVCCRWLLRFMTPIMHPTFMFRRETPPGFKLWYDPEFTVTEDHDFTTRIVQYGDIVSLSDVLLDYRQHGSSISHKNWTTQGQQSAMLTLRHCQAELPAPVLEGLSAFRNMYHLQKREDPAAVFAGLRKMLAEDKLRHPEHMQWIRRQTAQLAHSAFQRAGFSKGEILRAFAGPGRDFAPHLALRLLEVKRWLPAGLRSDPQI